jgi:hypothetical protein
VPEATSAGSVQVDGVLHEDPRVLALLHVEKDVITVSAPPSSSLSQPLLQLAQTILTVVLKGLAVHRRGRRLAPHLIEISQRRLADS